MMRAIVILLAGCGLAMPQPAIVQMLNLSRPSSADFQVGDRFEIIVSGAPHQPVSVRTARGPRTDWGPVIASTDASGRWTAKGLFEKTDFGSWREVWTVAGKVANPVVSFWVGAPCVKGGRGFSQTFGPNTALTCGTPDGKEQTFVTPSLGDSFRTPDGRVIPGDIQSNQTAEAYHLEIMQSMIGARVPERPVKLAAEAGELIAKLIGPNALTDTETRSVLAIVRSAYAPLNQFRAGEAEKPAMLALLEQLAAGAEQQGLKDEIAGTIEFVQRQ